MTIADVARTYPLSKSLLYEMCRLGKLKHYRVGTRGRGKILIDEKDIADLLAACRKEGPADEEDEEELTFLK